MGTGTCTVSFILQRLVPFRQRALLDQVPGLPGSSQPAGNNSFIRIPQVTTEIKNWIRKLRNPIVMPYNCETEFIQSCCALTDLRFGDFGLTLTSRLGEHDTYLGVIEHDLYLKAGEHDLYLKVGEHDLYLRVGEHDLYLRAS
jgi:hypothetical protein